MACRRLGFVRFHSMLCPIHLFQKRTAGGVGHGGGARRLSEPRYAIGRRASRLGRAREAKRAGGRSIALALPAARR